MWGGWGQFAVPTLQQIRVICKSVILLIAEITSLGGRQMFCLYVLLRHVIWPRWLEEPEPAMTAYLEVKAQGPRESQTSVIVRLTVSRHVEVVLRACRRPSTCDVSGLWDAHPSLSLTHARSSKRTHTSCLLLLPDVFVCSKKFSRVLTGPGVSRGCASFVSVRGARACVWCASSVYLFTNVLVPVFSCESVRLLVCLRARVLLCIISSFSHTYTPRPLMFIVRYTIPVRVCSDPTSSSALLNIFWGQQQENYLLHSIARQHSLVARVTTKFLSPSWTRPVHQNNLHNFSRTLTSGDCRPTKLSSLSLVVTEAESYLATSSCYCSCCWWWFWKPMDKKKRQKTFLRTVHEENLVDKTGDGMWRRERGVPRAGCGALAEETWADQHDTTGNSCCPLTSDPVKRHRGACFDTGRAARRLEVSWPAPDARCAWQVLSLLRRVFLVCVRSISPASFRFCFFFSSSFFCVCLLVRVFREIGAGDRQRKILCSCSCQVYLNTHSWFLVTSLPDNLSAILLLQTHTHVQTVVFLLVLL